MNPVLIRDFFSAEEIQLMRLQLETFKGPAGASLRVREDRELFFRKGAHNPPFFTNIHLMLVDRAGTIFGNAVKPSYVFVSMYDDERSVCPVHIDNADCRFTIDVCLNQKSVWPLFINDQPYELNPGDAVCYSGTHQPHYREKIQPGNFCDLVFFHFVPA